jgi:hypothetical protein
VPAEQADPLPAPLSRLPGRPDHRRGASGLPFVQAPIAMINKIREQNRRLIQQQEQGKGFGPPQEFLPGSDEVE